MTSLARIAGGGNSAVYRLDAGGASFALKVYPTTDPRDRSGVERTALQLFERHGIEGVPRWRGGADNLALLDWIDGAAVIDPSLADVDDAAAFIARLRPLGRVEGADLPLASEACLSGAEILRQLDARLARLAARDTLRDFLAGTFAPARRRAEAAARATGLDLDTTLPVEKRMLIPADLGFHNVLRDARTGRLVFLDFEYFGWDDPVKLVADFVLHPGHRLAPPVKARFLERMHDLFTDDDGFALRLRALRPLFALRWALILVKNADQLDKAAVMLREAE
jgi:hypothetical protein